MRENIKPHQNLQEKQQKQLKPAKNQPVLQLRN